MKVTTEEFLTNFHALSGVTIGERRKNLFLYLNTIDPNDLDVNFSMVQPKTPLEEKFKIDALIFFKKVPDLLEILKCENPLLIRRVLKNSSWFINEAFHNVSGEELMSVVFPHVSLKVKLKIINKLCKNLDNTQQADEYFEAIKNKYGLHLASKLLSSCSLEKILAYIKFHKIKFSYRQILKVIKKYPESTEQILDIMNGYSDNFNDEYIAMFKYFSRNDIAFFLNLREKHKSQFKAGWRVTEKFVQSHKEEIIQKHEEIFKVFHKKRAVKTLGNNYSRIFIKLFPTSINNYPSQIRLIFSAFKSLPKKMQDINLLLNSFEQAYGSSLLSHPEYITADILNMIPISQREGILKIENKPSQMSEDDWYCYYKTSISIPYLKKRIALTSDINTRVELICSLVKTCSLNDDMEALAQLCEYMVKRHRNDHVSIRGKFLRTLEEKINLKKLTQRHWDSIQELIQIFTLNGENCSQAREFLIAFIYFRLENQLPIKDQLTEVLKDHDGGFRILKDNPKYEKECLLMTYKIGSDMYDVNDTENYRSSVFYNNFIAALYDWNTRHPEDVISLFTYPTVVEFIKNGIKKNDRVRDLDRTLMRLLREQPDHEETQSILKGYFSMSPSYIDGGILNFIIKYRPLTVSENIEVFTKLAITKSYWRDDYFFWIFSKNYTHLDVPQRMIPLCIESHQTCDGAVSGLSRLMSKDEFLNFITPYYPTTLQADSKTEEGRKLYETQRLITKYLANVQPASAILPSILKFCRGDYLKLIIRSLYSAADTTNEDKLTEFLSAFTDAAVSVRKHAMHLAFRLLDQTSVFGLLSRFMETEKNASIRKFLFKGIFNYFVKNPDDRSWELVKLNLGQVDVEDKEALEVLMEVDKIPTTYVSHYIVFTYQFLDNYGDKYLGEKCSLLRKVTPVVLINLPKEFCESIISKYFFKCEDDSLSFFQSEIQTFTCRFIIYCEDKLEQEQRLIKYFDITTKFANVSCEDRNTRMDRRNCVVNFLKEFCLRFIAEGCSDKPILYKFVELWNKLILPHQGFQEYLHLQFTLIFVEKLSLVEVGRKISQLFNAAVNSYGVAAVQVFHKYLMFFLKYFYDNNETEAKRMVLVESIMECDHSAPSLLLIILLLSKDGEPSDDAMIVKYSSIIDLIRSSPDQIVQIYLATYLAGSTTLDYY